MSGFVHEFRVLAQILGVVAERYPVVRLRGDGFAWDRVRALSSGGQR